MNLLKGHERAGFKGSYRLNEERLNNQNCPMKIIKYNGNHDIIVEFQDKYLAKVHTNYDRFQKGNVKNPYYPSVYGVGMIGNKYASRINGIVVKEYDTWTTMLQRCYNMKFKERNPTYKDVICCNEWLLYENFYEWIHNQPNFDKWLNGDKWAIDKDILVKGNRIYSPNTCCLVPHIVNGLFEKGEAIRGNLPIGVGKSKKKFQARCRNPFTKKVERLGNHSTPEEAFYVYKEYKENLIKQVAQEEYNKGNITKECYKAMINYEVEITD